jgi:hypothetical protein
MIANGAESLYDDLIEPLSLALGHLVFAGAVLEDAMLADLIHRRVGRDGADQVFGKGIVASLERKPAGALLRALREVGYDEPLAEDMARAIDGRNHFIHHLFEDPEFMEAVAKRDGIDRVVTRVEALVQGIYGVVRRLEPGMTSGLQAMFGRSAADLLAVIRDIDPDDFEGQERLQLEALQKIPEEWLGESSAGPGERAAGHQPNTDPEERDASETAQESPTSS